MAMSSSALEKPFSAVEVSVISSHGVWLQVKDREVFMSYDDYPGLRDAPIAQVLNVTEPTPGHLYWPDLDVVAGIETTGHSDSLLRKAN
jgi:Protein of unknown function (DUF2442)